MPQVTSFRPVLIGSAIILAGCSDAGRVTEPGPPDASLTVSASQPSQKTLKVKTTCRS
jgi:hypothetical protein